MTTDQKGRSVRRSTRTGTQGAAHAAKKKGQRTTDTDFLARAQDLLREAALTHELADGYAYDFQFDRSAVHSVLEEAADYPLEDHPVLVETPSQACVFVTACAYGAIRLVEIMSASIEIPAETAAEGLRWAASFDCGDLRVCCQSCDEKDDGPCCISAACEDYYCILGVRREGKLDVLRFLRPMCGEAAVAQALATATEWRQSFQDSLEYHKADVDEAREELRPPGAMPLVVLNELAGKMGGDENDADYENNADCAVSAENVEFAQSMIDVLSES